MLKYLHFAFQLMCTNLEIYQASVAVTVEQNRNGSSVKLTIDTLLIDDMSDDISTIYRKNGVFIETALRCVTQTIKKKK